MKKVNSLATLNNGDPNRLHDAFRAIDQAGYDVTKDTAVGGFGDLINKLIALANQGSGSTAASVTATYGGTATTGDILNISIDGEAYTYTVADGTSVTTAITGMKTALNADADFAKRWTASNAAGVLTITAKRKGVGYNGKAFSVTKTGTGTWVAGAAALAGGLLLDDILPIADVN